MKEVIETGRTVELALEAAREKIGDPNAEFEVLEMPRKTLFGLKTIPAKVKVWIPEEAPAPKPREAAPEQKPRQQAPAPQRTEPAKPQPMEQSVEPAKPMEPPKAAEPARPAQAVSQPNTVSPAEPRRPMAQSRPAEAVKLMENRPSEPARPARVPRAGDHQRPVKDIPPAVMESKTQHAIQYVTDILNSMGAEKFTVTSIVKGDGLTLEMESEDLGFIIGRRGETLDALQYLTGLAINRGDEEYVRVTLDSGNFRQKREQTLENLAVRLAKQVKRMGRSITLEPMNPYERRTIHAIIAGIEGVSSTSVGDEPNRRVVINSTASRKPSGNRPPSPPRSGERRPYSEPRSDGETEAPRAEGSETDAQRAPRPAAPARPREGECAPRQYGGSKPPYNRGERRERPAPYQPTTQRETPPEDGEQVKAPLYGKIEI